MVQHERRIWGGYIGAAVRAQVPWGNIWAAFRWQIAQRVAGMWYSTNFSDPVGLQECRTKENRKAVDKFFEPQDLRPQKSLRLEGAEALGIVGVELIIRELSFTEGQGVIR